MQIRNVINRANIFISKIMAKQKNKKRGGARKILRWQEKLSLSDRAIVTSFLCSTSCKCDNNCLFKILNLGARGVQLVVDLRDDRFAGSFSLQRQKVDKTVTKNLQKCYKNAMKTTKKITIILKNCNNS